MNYIDLFLQHIIGLFDKTLLLDKELISKLNDSIYFLFGRCLLLLFMATFISEVGQYLNLLIFSLIVSFDLVDMIFDQVYFLF